MEAGTKTMKEKIKKRKTYELRLTRTELVHLRDLFSVVLPPDVKKTLSQHLAEAEDREFIETKLWDKLIDLCKTAGVPVGDEAPDYVVAPTAAPPMSVFPMSTEAFEEVEEDQEA